MRAVLQLYVYMHRDGQPLHRLVFDRETGKPKGYGFCEYAGAS